LAACFPSQLNYCSFLAGELWQDEEMPRKRKPKKFSKVDAVKALARERIGTPPSSRVVPDRKKEAAEKHKPTLGNLLSEN
jgi:hypothetical protein